MEQEIIILFNQYKDYIIAGIILLILYNLFFKDNKKENVIDIVKLNNNVNTLIKNNQTLSKQVEELKTKVQEQEDEKEEYYQTNEKMINWYKEQIEFKLGKYLTKEQIEQLILKLSNNSGGSTDFDNRVKKIFSQEIKPQMEKFMENKFKQFNQNDKQKKSKEVQEPTPKNSYSNMRPTFL